MPPPHASQTRMTANPVRPARYRAGKPTGNDDPWASEDEGEEEEEEQESDDASAQRPPAAAPAKGAVAAAASLKTLDLDARARQAQEAERQRAAWERAERERREREAGFVTESESEGEESDGPEDHEATARPAPAARADGAQPDSDEEDEDSDSDEDSSEESSSEDERPRLIRPVFVKKNQRIAAPAPEVEAALQAEDEARRREEAANEVVRERIEKDAIARAAGRAGWDDDAAADEIPDDTDGVDPELERAEWIARELARIKRGKDALRAREEEMDELERRRQLTSAERELEDMDKVRQQQDERKNKPKMAYLQKYRHKGAFYMDDEHEALRARDLMGAEYEGQTNKELLPQALRLRDDTKLGRKGATKYKDLKTEDTGRFGDFGDFGGRRRGGYDGDDRFRPDRPDGAAATGANAGAVGSKRRAHEQDRHEAKRPRVEDGG